MMRPGEDAGQQQEDEDGLKATGPELRTISTSAVPGAPTGTDAGAEASSWKSNRVRGRLGRPT